MDFPALMSPLILPSHSRSLRPSQGAFAQKCAGQTTNNPFVCGSGKPHCHISCVSAWKYSNRSGLSIRARDPGGGRQGVAGITSLAIISFKLISDKTPQFI